MAALSGKWVSMAVSAAAELGVADVLAPGRRSAREIADAVRASEDAVGRLLGALVSVGVFARHPDGLYENNPVSELLRVDVLGSHRAMARWMGSPLIWQNWSYLAECVRRGESAYQIAFGRTSWDCLASSPEDHRLFLEAMSSLTDTAGEAVVGAYDFTRFSRIVDIGGAHGVMLEKILSSAPVAEGVLFDRPQVIEEARARLENSPHHARLRFAAGSFLEVDDVPAGGDAYLLKHVIHDWDDERSATILANVKARMAPNARVLIVEHLLDHGTEPSAAPLLDLEMLVLTEGGRERSLWEYMEIIDRACLRFEQLYPTERQIFILEASAA